MPCEIGVILPYAKKHPKLPEAGREAWISSFRHSPQKEPTRRYLANRLLAARTGTPSSSIKAAHLWSFVTAAPVKEYTL